MQADTKEWAFKIETRNLTAAPQVSRLVTFLEDSEDTLRLALERIVGAVLVGDGIISQNIVRIELHRIEKRGLNDQRVTSAMDRRGAGGEGDGGEPAEVARLALAEDSDR
jgi:hypothetical protein